MACKWQLEINEKWLYLNVLVYQSDCLPKEQMLEKMGKKQQMATMQCFEYLTRATEIRSFS